MFIRSSDMRMDGQKCRTTDDPLFISVPPTSQCRSGLSAIPDLITKVEEECIHCFYLELRRFSDRIRGYGSGIDNPVSAISSKS
jgi:hypothetical protein